MWVINEYVMWLVDEYVMCVGTCRGKSSETRRESSGTAEETGKQ